MIKEDYLALYMPVLEDLNLGGEYSRALNSIAASATVCPECHCDDFTHVESCNLKREALEYWFKTYGKRR